MMKWSVDCSSHCAPLSHWSHSIGLRQPSQQPFSQIFPSTHRLPVNFSLPSTLLLLLRHKCLWCQFCTQLGMHKNVFVSICYSRIWFSTESEHKFLRLGFLSAKLKFSIEIFFILFIIKSLENHKIFIRLKNRIKDFFGVIANFLTNFTEKICDCTKKICNLKSVIKKFCKFFNRIKIL